METNKPEGKTKRTRKPKKQCVVKLAFLRENLFLPGGIEVDAFKTYGILDILPAIRPEDGGDEIRDTKTIANSFKCDGYALEAAALIPKFIAEHDVRTVRVSERIMKSQKHAQIKMKFS